MPATEKHVVIPEISVDKLSREAHNEVPFSLRDKVSQFLGRICKPLQFPMMAAGNHIKTTINLIHINQRNPNSDNMGVLG